MIHACETKGERLCLMNAEWRTNQKLHNLQIVGYVTYTEQAPTTLGTMAKILNSFFFPVIL